MLVFYENLKDDRSTAGSHSDRKRDLDSHQPPRLASTGRSSLPRLAPHLRVGVSAIRCGLAIVNSHNRWAAGWPLLVTGLGWLAALGGLSRILFPSRLAGIAMQVVHTTGAMPIAAIIILLLGAFLSLKAYGRE